MFKFRMSTIENGSADLDTLAYWEISALFMDESSIHDLDIDLDQATEWYIDNIVDDNSKNDYRNERQTAEDEMIEHFTTSLTELATERSNVFGNQYPFIVEKSGKLTRKPISTIGSQAICYLVLQFFRAQKKGLIEIDGENSDETNRMTSEFNIKFRNLFEYIAAYAVSGKKSGNPYLTSESRSAERLNSILNQICRKIGSGKVLPLSTWSQTQKTTNDGRVDCLVHIGDSPNAGDASIILVGATVQKQNIQQKILGFDEIVFFGSFFSEKPAVFQIALVRPYDSDELTKSHCRDKNCMLFTYSEILDGLAASANLSYPTTPIRRVNAKIRKPLFDFKNTQCTHNYNTYSIS